MNSKIQNNLIPGTTKSLADVVEVGTLVIGDLMGGNLVAPTINATTATRPLIAQMLLENILQKLGERNVK